MANGRAGASQAIPARTRLMLEGPVTPTLLRLAAPNLAEAAARVGFIAADGVFIGWLGADALAGASLVFPLFLLSQTITAGGFGSGVAASIARALGAGQRDAANRLAANALWLALAAGLGMGILMLIAGPALYRALGASGATWEAAVAYSSVVLGGVALVWMMNLLANAVRGAGAMAVSAGAIVAGEAAHLALSPVLILGLGPFPPLGVVGAGLAVLAAYGSGAAILLFYLLSGRATAGLRRGALRPSRQALAEILSVGALSAVTVALYQATLIAATLLAAGFGAAALAGYGSGQRLELLQIPITFAFGSAVISMAAANRGAGHAERVAAVARSAMWLSGAIGLIFGAVALLLPATWMALFVREPAAAATGILYLRTVGATLPTLGLALGLSFALMGAGRPGLPAAAGAVRFAVVAAGGLLAVHGFGGGTHALFLSVAMAALCFTLLVLAFGRGLFRAARARRPRWSPDPAPG